MTMCFSNHTVPNKTEVTGSISQIVPTLYNSPVSCGKYYVTQPYLLSARPPNRYHYREIIGYPPPFVFRRFASQCFRFLIIYVRDFFRLEFSIRVVIQTQHDKQLYFQSVYRFALINYYVLNCFLLQSIGPEKEH